MTDRATDADSRRIIAENQEDTSASAATTAQPVMLTFTGGYSEGGRREIATYRAEQSGATQLDRHYYYRPCTFDGGKTLKCAGFGAETPEHKRFYRPHFRANADKESSGCPFMAGVVIVVGYHGDKISREYAIRHALNNDLPI